MTPEEYFQEAMKHHREGRLREAALMYDELLKHFPTHADCLNLRGGIKLQQGLPDSALALFERSIAAAPAFAGAHINRGRALHHLGRTDAALESYTRALELSPDAFEARAAKAWLLFERKRYEEVIADCDYLVARGHAAGIVLAMRGRALRELGRRAEALADLEKAIAADPQIELLAGEIAHLSLQLGEWRNLDTRIARVQAGIERGHLSAEPLVVTALPLSAAHQFKAASIYASRYEGRERNRIQAPRRADAPLRIGYFSSDFFDHASAHLMIGMLEAHDRRNVETIAFAFGGKADPFRGLVSNAVNEFVDAASLTDEQIVAHARDKSVHIAIDINGYAGGSRPAVFALGVAPIQVNYLGYPGTLGTAHHDYIIGDSDVTPLADAHTFSERIVTMPHSYQPNGPIKLSGVSAPVRREDVGLPERGFVFCCFNAGFKITPDVFDVWMRLLKAVEGGVLWLLEENDSFAANLRAEAAVRGVAPERIIFAPRAPIGTYLARFAHADVFLDTFHYNAHTTGGDALLMGVPVVTWRGETFAARVGASLLRATGFPELIAGTSESYEALALRLAREPTLLAGIRERLKRDVRSRPLFNPKLYARHLEAAFSAMWDRHERGLAPEHITVSAN